MKKIYKFSSYKFHLLIWLLFATVYSCQANKIERVDEKRELLLGKWYHTGTYERDSLISKTMSTFSITDSAKNILYSGGLSQNQNGFRLVIKDSLKKEIVLTPKYSDITEFLLRNDTLYEYQYGLDLFDYLLEGTSLRFEERGSIMSLDRLEFVSENDSLRLKYHINDFSFSKNIQSLTKDELILGGTETYTKLKRVKSKNWRKLNNTSL